MTQYAADLDGSGHPYSQTPGRVIWLVQVDWERDGAWGSEAEPQALRGLNIRRGRAKRVRADGAGQEQPAREWFRLEVRDQAGRYDSFNPASPISAYLGGSGYAVRVLAVNTSSNGPAECVFVGTLTQIDYRAVDGLAILTGEGLSRALMSGQAAALWCECQPFAPLEAWDSYFVEDGSTPFPVNYWKGRPGGLPLRECADLTLARAGWPFGAFYGEAIASTEQPDYFYFDGQSAWATLEELADGFAARLFVLRDGRLFVMDRSDQAGLLAGAPAPLRAQAGSGLERLSAFESLRNTVKVNIRAHSVTPFKAPYLAEYYSLAWSNAGPLALAPGETLEIDVRYAGGTGGTRGGSFISTNTSGFGVTMECWSAADRTGTRMDGSGTGDGEFTLLWQSIDGKSVPYGNNQGWTRVRFQNHSAGLTAYFFDAQVLVIGIRETGLPVVKQVVEPTSLALDGPKTLTINSRWVQSAGMGADIAQAYADALSSRQHASPASITYQWSGSALVENLALYDLGTHVNFGPQGGSAALNNFGMWGRWLVVGQNITWLSADGEDALVKLTFEKAAADLLAVVQERSSFAAGPGVPVSGLSFEHQVDCQPGRLLVVMVTIRAYQTVTSVSYAGRALSRHAAIQQGAGEAPRAEMWYLLAPPVGTASVAVSLSGADHVQACAHGLYNAHQRAPLGPAKTGSGAGAPASAFPVPGAAGDLVIDCLAYSGTPAAPGSGQTNLGGASSDGTRRLGTSRKPGAGNVTMSWNPASAWALLAAAVKAASG